MPPKRLLRTTRLWGSLESGNTSAIGNCWQIGAQIFYYSQALFHKWHENSSSFCHFCRPCQSSSMRFTMYVCILEEAIQEFQGFGKGIFLLFTYFIHMTMIYPIFYWREESHWKVWWLFDFLKLKVMFMCITKLPK